MTERMEPTNRLRWVRWPDATPADGRPGWRLQQLWAGPWREEGGEMVRVTQWRDVPVEDAQDGG